MAEAPPTHSGDGAVVTEPEPVPVESTAWSPPTLLSDAPATADEFGGGHARLARSLAGTIRDEDGGRAIALTGPYGSGKSTVVQLVEAELQSEDVAVFTFDAWAHSGDPLRRSFIEELVADLVRRGWTTEDEWKDDLLRLSRRRETTTITSSPKLTMPGTLLALALLLVPLGTAMLAKNGMSATRGVVGLSLLLTPLLVVAVAAGVRKWRGQSGADLSDLVPLLVRDRELETTTTTIRTPDPTTVEFEDLFRKVVGAVLDERSRKLVVVVDNLDRLLPDEATAAWSVMRTFFDGAARTSWRPRFWVVAPLALDGLAVRTSTGETVPEGDPVGKTHAKRQPGDDLITKTFAATLRVPPPVLSEWRDFFDAQLREAFPYWAAQAGELRAVYDLFLRLRVADGGPPTPRGVKSFVNRLAGLDRQWQSDVALRTLALYLLVGDDVSPDGSEIRSEDFVAADVQAVLGAGWRRDLAAIHFNVEPDKAFQLLVGEEVETALETADADRIRAISGTAGLGEAVLAIVRGGAVRWSLSEMASSAATLDAAGLERTVGIKEAWAELARKTVQRRSYFVGDPPAVGKLEVRAGLAALIRRAPSRLRTEVAVTITEAMSSGSETRIGETSAGEPETTTVADWVDAVEAIVAAVGDPQNKALYSLDVPAASAASYLLALDRVSQIEDEGLRFTVSRHARLGGNGVNAADVNAALVTEIEAGTFHATGAALRVMPLVENSQGELIDREWAAVIAALTTAADPDYQTGTEREVAAVVGALVWLNAISGAKAEAKAALNSLAPDTLARQLASAEEPLTVGTLLLALLVATAKPKQPPKEATPTAAGIDRAADYDDYVRTVSRPAEHSAAINAAVAAASAEVLRGLAARRWVGKQERDLHRAVLVAASERPDVAEIFDIEVLSKNPEIVEAALGSAYDDMVRDRVSEIGPDGIPVGLQALHPITYRAVTAALGGQAKVYLHRVLEAYTALAEDEWAEVITDWHSALRLAAELAEAEERVGPGSHLPAALLEHVRKVIAGEREPSSVPEETPHLYGFLPDAARDGFISRLRPMILDGGPAALRVALDGPYGLDLARTDGWEPFTTRLLNDFIPEVLDKASRPVAAWVVVLLRSSPEIVTAADRGLVAGLYDKVNGYYKRTGTSNVVKKELESIERLLAPRVPRKERKKSPIRQAFEKVLFGSSTPVKAKGNQTAPPEPSDSPPVPPSDDEEEG